MAKARVPKVRNAPATEVILDDIHGNTLSQKVRKVRMDMRGRLVMDNTIMRQIGDIISLRNHVVL